MAIATESELSIASLTAADSVVTETVDSFKGVSVSKGDDDGGYIGVESIRCIFNCKVERVPP